MVLSHPHHGYTSEIDRHSSMKLPPSTIYTIFRKPDPSGIRSLASTEEVMAALRVTSFGSSSCKDISKREGGFLTGKTGPGT